MPPKKDIVIPPCPYCQVRPCAHRSTRIMKTCMYPDCIKAHRLKYLPINGRRPWGKVEKRKKSNGKGKWNHCLGHHCNNQVKAPNHICDACKRSEWWNNSGAQLWGGTI